MSLIEELVVNTRLNAVLSWTLIIILSILSIQNFLLGSILHGGLTLFMALVSILPVLALRNPKAIVPWEILGVAVAPFAAETIFADFSTRYYSYLSTAAVATILAVELHLFTDSRMNDFFAVLFVTVTTVASAGFWALARWSSDLYLGTRFLISHDLLMWEFIVATFVGITAGIIFDLYFKHIVKPDIFDEVIL